MFPARWRHILSLSFHTWKHALKAINLIRQLHRKASDEREICLLFLWSPRTVENHGFCCDSSSVAIINSAGLPESPTWLPRRRFQRYINFRAKLSEVDYPRKSTFLGITVSLSKDQGAVEINKRASAVTVCTKCRMATGMVFMTLEQLNEIAVTQPVLKALVAKAIAAQWE